MQLIATLCNSSYPPFSCLQTTSLSTCRWFAPPTSAPTASTACGTTRCVQLCMLGPGSAHASLHCTHGSCSAAHDDAPLLFSHLLSHRHLACLPPCPLTLPCRPISPCLQDLIMRPEKFESPCPHPATSPACQVGGPMRPLGAWLGRQAGGCTQPCHLGQAGSRKLPLCAID